jgi:gamma-glutamylcyclotransferase (GGCT)/AIG2-like uncharacterized protein YtfP
MERATNLFVYGTLRRQSAHPMREVLSRHARWIGAGRFAGLLFDLGEYPGAVPDPSGSRWVVGDLYRMEEPERLLPILDAYERCAPAERAPEYRREVRDVLGPGGETVRAWVYLYNRPVDGRARIASGDYLRPAAP